MTPENQEILRRLVQARSGVIVDRTKPYVIESALGPIARREGFSSVDELIDAIRARRDERLMWAVVEAMSPSESMFFRDQTPFAAFREEILPTLAALRGADPVKIWSCACAAGQEIYSLAMLVDEDRPKLGAARVELFASDLSEPNLAKAQAGLYTQFEVQRGLPIKMLLRYFEKTGEMWRIAPVLRQMVRWRRINLLADLTPIGQFDVIYCRYVVSLFDEPIRQKVLQKLTAALSPGGYLVMGSVERADGLPGLQRLEGREGVYMKATDAKQAAA